MSVIIPSFEDFNLNNISILKKEFNCTVGLSDHSINNKVAIAAIGAGAEIFEKHIAIKASKKSPDFKFSLLENQIGEYRKCLNETYEMFKKNKFYRNKSEKFYKNFRRSIYAIRNIRKGDLFTENNIKLLIPLKGIGPEYYKKIINKKSPYNIAAETSLKKSILIKLKVK